MSATRRSFIQTAGAALSVPLAAAAARAPVSAAADDAPNARLAYLEDVEAIRALNQQYARHVNAGAHDAAAALFADPAEATMHPHVRRIAPVAFAEQDAVEIAPDGHTSTAHVRCTLHIESAMDPDCPLVEMARLQGGGVLRRTSCGVLESVYVRQERIWKIQRVSVVEIPDQEAHFG